MKYIPWTEKEFEDLCKTCKTCHTGREAALRHNTKWKTQRSADSIYAVLERHRWRAPHADDHLGAVLPLLPRYLARGRLRRAPG